MNSVETIFAF